MRNSGEPAIFPALTLILQSIRPGDRQQSGQQIVASLKDWASVSPQDYLVHDRRTSAVNDFSNCSDAPLSIPALIIVNVVDTVWGKGLLERMMMRILCSGNDVASLVKCRGSSRTFDRIW